MLASRLLSILIIYYEVRQNLAVGSNKTYGIGFLQGVLASMGEELLRRV